MALSTVERSAAGSGTAAQSVITNWTRISHRDEAGISGAPGIGDRVGRTGRSRFALLFGVTKTGLLATCPFSRQGEGSSVGETSPAHSWSGEGFLHGFHNFVSAHIPGDQPTVRADEEGRGDPRDAIVLEQFFSRLVPN